MKILLSLLMVSNICCGTLMAGEPNIPRQFQTLLNQTLQDNPQVPGISMFVLCPDLDLNWVGASGKVSRKSVTVLTPKHTFRIASNTKTYVAAAILRLVEMEKLNLEDPLGDYLPDQWSQWLEDDGYDLDVMTLRMVLSHTAGLNDHANDDRYSEAILADPQHRWKPDDQIRMLVEWFDPVGEPGEQYSYSDDGYILLGRILEEETGRPLGPAVRSLLDFDGLGLSSTWWEIMEEPPAGAVPRAHQYFYEHDTWEWDPSLDLYGGGGLVSDTKDLGLFMRKLLKGEVLKTEAMLEEMKTSGTPDYRLGLICPDLGGTLALGHGGFWNTFAYHVPEMDLTVSGCILNHDAIRGLELVKEVVALAQEAMVQKQAENPVR